MSVTPEHLTIEGRGVALAADRWQAPAHEPRRGSVLLLHGGGQTRHSWQQTGARLATHGWTSISVDARGHGDSGWAADGDYSQDAMIADLRAVAATLDEPPILVGASMGGMTSLLAQGEDPGFALGLVLVDVTPRIEPEGSAEITAFMRSGMGGFDSLEEAADAVMAYNPHRKRPPRPEGLRKNLRERDGRWYWHWDPRFLGQRGEGKSAEETARDLTGRAVDAARAIRVPALLVRGSESRIVSPEGARELLTLIPHARVIDVQGAGHMVAGDDNDVFAQGLLGFLDECVSV
ncbi:alpha/beta hydrolase [Amycolatopsis sp. K13G38]|uniref:Alpha/beta hydrolase n=1 Tax=Amycolatopsis acididurans TaxID=2724524 RepID=A0ABX1JAH2_9PSEU|nr:alpha/beta hydrolase [Amycolatopsis acididurans]NKQ56766.1 alpha/beta hydrolase [Amycolatopsis acididurans]